MRLRPIVAALACAPVLAGCALTGPVHAHDTAAHPARTTRTAHAHPTKSAHAQPRATTSPTMAPTTVTSPLDGVLVADPHDDGTYDRTADFGGWRTTDGCGERDRILARDMTNVATDDGCDVKSGTLHDLYTGQTLAFTDSHYWTVQIDHIYPLHLAYEEGAEAWTKAKREDFNNDPANLAAVDTHSNESKGDSGPGEWLPADHTGACIYAHRYVRVAKKYDLPITPEDMAALRTLFPTCTKDCLS